MVRSPCCDGQGKNSLKKGPWTQEEDQKLIDCINKHGHGSWRRLPKLAGLNRCGKSCRLRWANYLRPDIKRGKFSEEDEMIMINLHAVLGNKWSKIASYLPGRTDNEIKNYWNTHMRKKLLNMGIDPKTHKPRTDLNHLLGLYRFLSTSTLFDNNLIGNNNNNTSSSSWDSILQLGFLQNVLRMMNPTTGPNEGSFFATQNLVNRGGIIPEANTNFRMSLGNRKFNQNGPKIQMAGSWDVVVKNQLPSLVSVSQDGSNVEQKIIIGDNSGLPSNMQTDSLWNVLEENQPPHSVSFSVSKDGSNVEQDIITGNKADMVNNCNRICYIPTSVSASSLSEAYMLETWEKLIDDDTIDSFWKTFLDLTSSNSSPVEL